MKPVPFDDLPGDLLSSARAVPLDDLPDDLRPPSRDRGYLSNVGGLLVGGAESAMTAARVSPAVIAGGDTSEHAELIAGQLRRPADADPPELREVKGAFKDDGEAWESAEGFWESAGAIGGMLFEVGRQTVTNPKGLSYLTAEQAANMVPAIVGMLAGGKAGAMVGGAAGPVGAAVGAAGGAALGAFGGSAPIEVGSEFIGLVRKELAARGLEPTNENVKTLLQDQQFTQQAVADAKVKGATTAGIDAALTVVAGGVATGPRRAALKAATEELGAGADAAQIAKRAGDILSERSMLQRAGTAGKAVGVDVAGGGISEAGGQLAAYGEVDLADVGLEMLGELGGTAMEVPAAARAVTSHLRRPADVVAPPSPVPTPEDVQARTQEIAQQALGAASNADEAIQAANMLAGNLDDMTVDVDTALERTQAARAAAMQAGPAVQNVQPAAGQPMNIAAVEAPPENSVDAMPQAGLDVDPSAPFERGQVVYLQQDGRAAPVEFLGYESGPIPPGSSRAARIRTAGGRGHFVDAASLSAEPPPPLPMPLAPSEAAVRAKVQQQDERRLARAAQEGARRAGALDPLTGQNPIDTAMRRIEARGGVATPSEAVMLDAAGAGRPYDRVDPSLEPMAPPIEQPRPESGLVLPARTSSRGVDAQARQRAGQVEAAEQVWQERAERRAAEAAQPAPMLERPVEPPPAAAVTAAFVAGPTRTAEQQAVLGAARRAYSETDLDVLRRAALAPYTLTADEHVRYRAMRSPQQGSVAGQPTPTSSPASVPARPQTEDASRVSAAPRPELRFAPPERQRLAQLQERRERLSGQLHGTTGRVNPVVARQIEKVDDQIARIRARADRRTGTESRDPLLFGADTGVPRAQVQAMVDRITANLPGSSDVEIRVVRTRLDVDDIEGVLPSLGAEGIYFPASETDGQVRPARIYLMAQALPTMDRAEQVLAHELVGHFGMEALLGERFSAVLDDVVRLGRAPEDARIGRQRVGDPYYATMEAVAQDYPDYSPANQAREVLARMAETNVRPHLLELVYAHIRRFLRRLGIQAPLSAAEIKTMVVDAAKQLRRTSGTQALRGSLSAAESLRAAESRRTEPSDGSASATDTRDSAQADTQASIQEVIEAAQGAGHASQKAVLGSVSPWLAQAGRDAGYELDGYSHVLDGSAVRHILKHTDSRAEQNRGNLPLTQQDIAAIPDLVNNPDKLVFGQKNKIGRDLVMYLKRMPDGTTLYLEEIRTGRKELAAQTMRKYPATTPDSSIIAALRHTRSKPTSQGDLIVVERGGVDNSAEASDSEPLESRATNIFGDPVPATWQAPAETKMADVIYTMQDKHVDTRDVVKAIKQAGHDIEDRWNPYLQEELYHGRAAKATADFLNDELRPLLVEMQARRIDMEEFETYLHNLHAEERNQQIAKVNPQMPDGGSGINTADAQAYLAGLDPVKRRGYEALAKRVQAISAGTRQLLVRSGMETPDTIRAWENTYSNYVPLQREDMDFGQGPGTGQGYSTRGSASKRATGSSRKVVDILANIAMQRERAITRAEKNRVATALYGLAVLEPNTDFWMAVNPQALKDPSQTAAELVQMGLNPLDAQNLISEPRQAYIDPRTGLVAYRVNPALRNASNVMAVRVNGQDRFVFFNERNARGQRMAAALKNLDADQLGTAMGVLAKITRWFAAVNTQYNPIFGIVNFTRDTQAAALQLATTELRGKEGQVMGNLLPALRGIYSQIRADRKGKGTTSTWAALWDQFQRAGGKTGYRDQFQRSNERALALEKELKKIGEGKVRQAGRAIFDWLSDYNDTMENAVRLAAFKTALDNGITPERAASIAKNLTVNFNRKGQIATQASAMYAFFNAAVQGSTRMVETLAGPTGKRIIGGGLLLGVMQALALSAAGYDDDEPPEFVRERSLIIPLGDGKYVTIPMPLGYNVIPHTSRVLTEFAMAGWRDPSKRITQIAGAFMDTFNPIGNAGWSLQTVSPTALDPFAALSENRDWTGKPIAREDFSSLNPTPGYTRAKETASAIGGVIAYALNAASGGTDFKPGMLSPTPDQIDYLVGQVFGGVGREANKIVDTIKNARTGEATPPYKIPLVGRFYGNTQSGAAESSRFYENVRQLNMHENEIKGRRETGGDVMGYLRDFPEARMVRQANKMEADIRKLRKRRADMLERDVHPENIKMVEMEITNRQKRFNDQVRRLREGAPRND